MTPGRERLLWACALVSAVVGFSRVPTAAEDRIGPAASMPSAVGDTVRAATRPAHVIQAPTLFRADRTPPLARYDPDREESSAEVREVLGRPQWRLTGVVRGRDWVALLEEDPNEGRATRLARVGDRLAGYEIRAIYADSLLVRGGDSIWTLGLERPWR